VGKSGITRVALLETGNETCMQGEEAEEQRHAGKERQQEEAR
jgi:hypothetical protein